MTTLQLEQPDTMREVALQLRLGRMACGYLATGLTLTGLEESLIDRLIRWTSSAYNLGAAYAVILLQHAAGHSYAAIAACHGLAVDDVQALHERAMRVILADAAAGVTWTDARA